MKYLFLFLLIASLHSYAYDNIPTDSVSFSLGKDNRIYVLCRINDSDTLRFLFDTGATDMVINSNSPKAGFTMKFDQQTNNQGATGTNVVPVSSSNTFCIGHQSVSKIPFIAIAYPPEVWDGVLGLRIIKKQVTEINYDKMKIYFYDPKTFIAPKNAQELPIKYILGVPVVPVTINVNNQNFNTLLEIDTGSDRIMDLNTPFVKKHNLMNTQIPFAISQVSSSDGNNGILHNVFFEKISLGNLHFYRIPGAFSSIKQGVQASAEMDGVMGNNFLKRFNMIYDPTTEKIYLTPNNLIYSPFYDFLNKVK